jgi:hypothetical protein
LNIFCSSTFMSPKKTPFMFRLSEKYSACTCQACYLSTSVLHFWLDHHRACIPWRVKIMKLLLMHYFQAFNFFFLCTLKIKFSCVLRMCYRGLCVILFPVTLTLVVEGSAWFHGWTFSLVTTNLYFVSSLYIYYTKWMHLSHIFNFFSIGEQTFNYWITV